MVARMRATGGDDTSVEVKSAAGGLPEILTSTLSALANLPSGGTIILGLDENAGFRPVNLANSQALKQGSPTRPADTSLPPYTVKRALRQLRGAGLVAQHGGKGRITTYQRTNGS